jgi:hypothetical protein
MPLPLPIPGPFDPASVAAFAPLAYEDDHEGAAIDLFLEQFRPRAVIGDLLRSSVAQVQDLENTIWGVLLSTDLDLAQNAQLDGLGLLVGEPRRDELDPAYRQRIKVRILVNRSNGRHAEILRILTMYLDVDSGAGTVELRESGPGALALNVYTTPTSPAELRNLAYTVKPGGVNLDGRYETSTSRPYRFGWSGGAITGQTVSNADGWSGDDSYGGLMAARI